MASPADKNEIGQFLAQQLPYVRAYLQDGSITYELQRALTSKPTFEAFFQAQDDYEELLKRHPAVLKKDRQRVAKLALKLALSRLPSSPLGARREDALAQQAVELQQAGMTLPDIARELNRKHPDREDRKGNKKPLRRKACGNS